MEVKKIVEGMTAPQVAQVIDDNFKAQNAILEEDIAKQNNVIGVSEYKDFTEAEAVNVGDVRKYNGLLYECVEATTGAFDASKWKKSSFKAETEKKLSELGSEAVKGNTINLFNPASKLDGLIGNGEVLKESSSYFSYAGIKLQSGHRYRLLNKDLSNYAGPENYLLFQTSDRVFVRCPLKDELSVAADAISPIVYISSFRDDAPEGVAPLNAENLMFVDVTNGIPSEFVPYYLDSYLKDRLDAELPVIDSRVTNIEADTTKTIKGNSKNLLNPNYLRPFIDGSNNLLYLSHNPMMLTAGHKYGLYRYLEYSGKLSLGAGTNFNVLVISDNYSIQRYPDVSVLEIPSDMVNPIGYVTNYRDESNRVDYSLSMFVDVTDGEPTTFKPYYDNKWYVNKIGDIFGYATVYSGSISIDTRNLTVTAKGRFFIDSSFRRATNSMVDVTIEETVTNIETNTLSAIHYLVWDVQAKAFYIWRASTYNPLVMTKALVIVGFGPLDDGGSRFYSLCNELIIDGHHYIANPSSKLESLQKSVESLQESAITKSLERTENLFNYRDETYKNKTISDDGIWSTNYSFSTVAIPLEAGKTYKRYAQANKLDNWGATNIRIFSEDGTFVLKTQSSSIEVPNDAVNPIGYFVYYNSLGDYNPSLFMVLPDGVSGDEQLPYLRGSITDEDLIAFIESKLRDIDISNSIVQTSGSSTNKVMSQNAVTNYIANKILEVTSRSITQTTGQSTELPMSQKAVTDALSVLSEQIGGEPTYRFAERPDSGYENFLVDVNCSIADNTTVSDAVQDSRDIKQDRCILKLPVNYSRSGEPVRLVICGHGTGWKCTASTTIPWAGMNTQLLLNEGYAVLGCNGTPGELDGLDQGHNCVPECYRSILAAYKYVIEKYNIKRDGVLTAGLSMGTYMTGQIALFTEIPVLAQVFYSFSGEIWKAQYTFKPTVRQRMCEKFGFTGIAPTFTTNNPPSAEEQEYIKSNMDKWSGYNLLVKGITNKNILSLYDVWVASSVITSEQEAELYNDAIVVGRPPCKFFICKDDTVSPKRWSEYMAKMIRNGGGYAELRYYETGGHSSWNAGENITIATKYGGNMTVNGSSYEGLLFLQKFDK